MVQRATNQQEEQKRDGGIEPGMFAVMHGLPQRHRIGERDRKGDRHIHIGAAAFQHGPCGGVEEPAAIDQRRCGDEGGDPVKHVTRGIIGTGPDGNGQKHDVGSGETAKGDCAHEITLQLVAIVERGIEEIGVIAGCCSDRADEIGRIDGRCVGVLAPDDGDAFGGKIDAGFFHCGHDLQCIFDRDDAGAAMDAGYAQINLPPALAEIAACQQHFFGRRCGSDDLAFRSGCAAAHYFAPWTETRSAWWRMRCPPRSAIASTIQ
ncbi:hypothetical protein D3C80_838880 [compost metagenome]